MLCQCKSSPSFFKALPFNYTSLKKESCEKDLLVMAIAILALTTLGALLATASSACHWWSPFSFTAGASYYPALGVAIGGGVLMIALTTLLIIRYCHPKTMSSKDLTQLIQSEKSVITPTPTGEEHNQTPGSDNQKKTTLTETPTGEEHNQTPGSGNQKEITLTETPTGDTLEQKKNPIEQSFDNYDPHGSEQLSSDWTMITPNEAEKK